MTADEEQRTATPTEDIAVAPVPGFRERRYSSYQPRARHFGLTITGWIAVGYIATLAAIGALVLALR